MDPGVAGVSCPPGSGGATGFRAPSLMTTGGGMKSAEELAPALEAESSVLAFRAMNGDGDHDPCAKKTHDAGATDAGAESGDP